MENYYSTVQTTAGNVVNGASITVYDASTGLAATIYEPDGVTPLSNPFLSGYARSEGEIEFGAANGQYNIRIVNGTETDWIYRISLFDTSLSGLGALAYEDDASGVPVADAGGYYTSTDVEGALQEAGADLAAHLADTTDSHDASAISITDAGGYFASIEVESALQEEREFSLAHINNATDAHDASAISVLDTTGYYTGSDVETALAEIGAQNDIALAIGRITNPLVDLRLQNGVNLVNGAGAVTYACASTSAYIDRYGDIQAAAIDEPRFESGGYLNEPASTNYAIYSEPTVAQLSTGTAVTDEVVSWLGYFTTAIGFGDNSTQRVAFQTYSDLSLVDNCVSVFVKMDDGDAPVVGATPTTGDFSLVCDSSIVANAATVEHIKDGVYRVSAYKTHDGVSAGYGVIKYTTQSARTFKVTGFQIEANRRAPTSYIPTVGAALPRAETGLSFPCYDNIPSLDDGVTILVDMVVGDANKERIFYAQDSAGIDAAWRTASSGSNSITTLPLGGLLIRVNPYDLIAGESLAYGVRVKNTSDTSSEWAIFFNGVMVGSGTLAAAINLPDSVFEVGRVTSSNVSNHKINRLRIGGYLTDAEMRIA